MKCFYLVTIFLLVSSSIAQHIIYINDEDIYDYYGSNWAADGNDDSSGSEEGLRESLSFLEDSGGGSIYINTTMPIDIIYGALTIYSNANNSIPISIIGIPDGSTNELPTINFGNYYLYSFRNINITLENLNIVGNEEYTYNGYYYIDGKQYIIGYNGGCIGVENGTLTVNNCTFTNCEASNSGGAIYVTNSDLLVTNSVFENNIAQSSYDEGGGGIYFKGVNNSISIINNEFNGNIGKYGGAIQINSSNNVTIQDNVFSSNLANSKGGVLYTNCDITNIMNCEFINNYAQDGGSIYIENGIIYITEQSLFEGNGATEGGAIYNSESEIYIENVQFLENSASSIGGAIFNTGTMTILGCLFSENSASDSNSNNILSQAEYYHNLILVANIFNGSNGCDFSSGSLYATVDTCLSKKNNTKYNCPMNTTCSDQMIGFRCVCPPGTYQEGIYENIQCISCDDGYYCPDNATNTPFICPKGSYCTPERPFVCPIGFYCPYRNTSEPIYCRSNNNLSCAIGAVRNRSDVEIMKYNEDIEFNQKEYRLNTWSVLYDDKEEYNNSMWYFQMNIILICVITLSLLWMCLTYIVVSYNIRTNKYINKLKTIDFFSMNHYHHLGIPIKKKKTLLGGSITLLFIVSVIFVTWFYTLRYKYDNSETVVIHVTNSTKNQANFLTIGFGFDGVISPNDDFKIHEYKGIASNSKIRKYHIYHNNTYTSTFFRCENCKFIDDKISFSVCSKSNETYLRKIFWNATTHSFRKDRISTIQGVLLPTYPVSEVWKNNGTETPIIILFFKPVSYSNVWYPSENFEGYSLEYQERFIGATRNKCNFLGVNVCSKNENLYAENNVRDDTSLETSTSYEADSCEPDKVGIKIIIKRNVGYYDVRVKNKYMMMDLLAEVFAMLGASFAGIAYLMVGIEIMYPKTKGCKKKMNSKWCLCRKTKKIKKCRSAIELHDFITKNKYNEQESYGNSLNYSVNNENNENIQLKISRYPRKVYSLDTLPKTYEHRRITLV